MIKANYHTHTARCGHAEGTDEAYVLAAIGQGFAELGFSDHVPWPYASGYTHTHVRMTVDRLGEYLSSVRALGEKYAGQIRILAGFECEYFPDYMDWLAGMKQERQLDYLIFGNHYEGTDEGGFYFGSTRTAAELRRYVDSAVKGIETGLFAYIAHPDLFLRRYTPFDDSCRSAARELCAACRAYDLPMEYNVHDRYIARYTHRTSYPHPEFFDIAREEGVRVIVGLDAHEPDEIADSTQWNRAMDELAGFGPLRLDRLPLGK